MFRFTSRGCFACRGRHVECTQSFYWQQTDPSVEKWRG
jgi:hypothetical protein